MTREEAKARLAKYLKSNFIKFSEVTEDGIVSYRMTYEIPSPHPAARASR